MRGVFLLGIRLLGPWARTQLSRSPRAGLDLRVTGAMGTFLGAIASSLLWPLRPTGGRANVRRACENFSDSFEMKSGLVGVLGSPSWAINLHLK